MGRKRKTVKTAAVKKEVVGKPEVVAKTEAGPINPKIRMVPVTPEDKDRLMKAFVNHRVHCQQCNHQQSLEDCKALIIGTYTKDGETNVHYNIDTGMLTITQGDKK